MDVSPEAVTLRRSGTHRQVDRDRIGGIFADGRDLVITDERTNELLRAKTDQVLVDRLSRVLEDFGYPWQGSADPHEEEFVTWVDGGGLLAGSWRVRDGCAPWSTEGSARNVTGMNSKSGKNETRVSRLRKSAGWTQERLSEQSGVPVRTIQRLEAGNETSLETLSRVADALTVDVGDLFVTTEGDGFAAAIGGLDERRARRRRHRSAWNIVGWALITIGALVGVGGMWGSPGQSLTYAIGGLITLTAGLWMVRGRPWWLPMVSVWVTAGVTLVYMLAFEWLWWVYGCAAVAVIAAGTLMTWLLVSEKQRSV